MDLYIPEKFQKEYRERVLENFKNDSKVFKGLQTAGSQKLTCVEFIIRAYKFRPKNVGIRLLIEEAKQFTKNGTWDKYGIKEVVAIKEKMIEPEVQENPTQTKIDLRDDFNKPKKVLRTIDRIIEKESFLIFKEKPRHIDKETEEAWIEKWKKKNKYKEIPKYLGRNPLNQEAKLQQKRNQEEVQAKIVKTSKQGE